MVFYVRNVFSLIEQTGMGALVSRDLKFKRVIWRPSRETVNRVTKTTFETDLPDVSDHNTAELVVSLFLFFYLCWFTGHHFHISSSPPP